MPPSPRSVAGSPAPGPAAAPSPGDALVRALEKSQAELGAGVDAWTAEVGRLVATMIADGAEALDQFRRCASPLEAMAVQQAWLAARTKAYFDAGARLLGHPAGGERPGGPSTPADAPAAPGGTP